VATKKVHPKAESRIENGASEYSKPCSKVNKMPKVTVMYSELVLDFNFPSRMAWWAHVTVTPEDNKRMVFTNGIFKGSNGITPNGGQK